MPDRCTNVDTGSGYRCTFAEGHPLITNYPDARVPSIVAHLHEPSATWWDGVLTGTEPGYSVLTPAQTIRFLALQLTSNQGHAYLRIEAARAFARYIETGEHDA